MRYADSVSAPLRLLALMLAAGVVLWLTHNVLLLAFFATLFAVLLRGASVRLAPLLHVSEWAMMAILVTALLAAAAAALYFGGPAIMSQSEQLYSAIVRQGTALDLQYGRTGLGRWLMSHLSKTDANGHPVLMVAGSTVELAADAVVLVITALYLASAPRLYVNGLVRLLPLNYRPRGRRILEQIGNTLWWWLVGQGIDMLVVGVLAAIGFLIMGVPSPFLLGLITGMLTFIPYFGPFLSAIPAALSGLIVGLPTAVCALAVLLVCHIVEGYVLAPLVQRHMVRLPPALTILALALFGTLFGSLGAILGTPLAAVLLVIVQQGYVADLLGDTEMREP